MIKKELEKFKLKFIDNHTHGAFGINFNYAGWDEIKFVLQNLYKRDIRGICPTLTGDGNIKEQLALFKNIKEDQLSNFQKSPQKHLNEAFVIGVHLEGSFLNPLSSGIQDESCFLELRKSAFLELVGEYIDIIKIVTLAPELDIDLIDYLAKNSIKIQAGHTKAAALNAKIAATTHHFNAMPQIHHRAASITQSALLDDEIYCEIIADLEHTSLETLKMFLKLKPIKKALLISDSLPLTHYDKDIIFCNKKIDKSGKNKDGKLAGSIKTLDEICLNLLKSGVLTVDEVKKAAFENQIEYLNLTQKEVNILNS